MPCKHQLIVPCLIAPLACVGATYDEATQGDLSNDRLSPTFIALDTMNNHVAGSVTFGERDYFTIDIPTFAALHAIDLEAYDSNNARAFNGMQAGNVFSVSPTNAEPSDMLGYTHFGFDQLSGDLLADMSTQFGAIGFATPLVSGHYTFWINQTEPSPTGCRFKFLMPARGDANLDGSVNFDDLLTLAQHYDQPGPHEWSAGDFNADGFVNFDDLLVLAQNYSGNDATLSFTPTLIDKWTLARSMVPEPTSLSAPLLLGVMTRRR